MLIAGMEEVDITITVGYAIEVIFYNTDKWDHIDPSVDFHDQPEEFRCFVNTLVKKIALDVEDKIEEISNNSLQILLQKQ